MEHIVRESNRADNSELERVGNWSGISGEHAKFNTIEWKISSNISSENYLTW